MVKQEQVKVLTSEVAKYQHHLMLEKVKSNKFCAMLADLDAQFELFKASEDMAEMKTRQMEVLATEVATVRRHLMLEKDTTK
jgi:hypothetical protein